MSCKEPCTYWCYFQVVRYHSLIIEAGSLPDDLLSISWTASPKLLSFLESDQTDVSNSVFWGSLGNFLVNPSQCSSNGGELSNTDSESDNCRVIMGIRHSSRPHYGVQVYAGFLYVIIILIVMKCP
jgi:para-aminobenzoate synthetase